MTWNLKHQNYAFMHIKWKLAIYATLKSVIDQNLINLDPYPGRIQVNKISKFSKHLVIFKTFNFKSLWTYFFLRFRLETFNFLRIKIFLLVKLCFSLHFISDYIPLDPDPRTQMNPNPTGSGSTSLIKIGRKHMLHLIMTS